MVWIETKEGFSIAQNQMRQTNPIFYICNSKQCERVPFVVTNVREMLVHLKKHERKKK